MFTRIVRTGLSRTVSTPAIAAQWTRWVAPRASSFDRLRVEDIGLVELEVRVLGERRARERVAVEVVGRDDLVLLDELARKGRSDEPGAAGDEDALALEHGASLLGLPSRSRCEVPSSSPHWPFSRPP